MDAAEDELFKLTTKGGKLVVETERVTTDTSDFDAGLIFEQDPVQIIDALLPLYLNSTLLRSLQVALSSPRMRARARRQPATRCCHSRTNPFTDTICHLEGRPLLQIHSPCWRRGAGRREAITA